MSTLADPHSPIARTGPLADPLSPVTRKDFLDLTSRNAQRILGALDRMSDEQVTALVEKKPKDMMVAGAVLLDKREMLRKEPEPETVIRDEAHFDDLGRALLEVLRSRRIKIEIDPAMEQMVEARKAIDVTPKKEPSGATATPDG